MALLDHVMMICYVFNLPDKTKQIFLSGYLSCGQFLKSFSKILTS